MAEEVVPVIDKNTIQNETEIKSESNKNKNKQKTFNFNGKRVNETEELENAKVEKQKLDEEELVQKQEKKSTIEQEQTIAPQENIKKYKLNSEDKKSITMEETSSKNLNKNVVIDEEEIKEVQPKMKLINEGDKVNPKLIYNLKNPDEK